MRSIGPIPPSSVNNLGTYLENTLPNFAQQQMPYTVTNPYTFTDSDIIDSLRVDATSGALVITLPSPTGSRRRRIIKSDTSANTVTVSAGGTILINGSTTVVLSYQYEYVTVEPTGTSWLIISRGTLTPSFNSVTFPVTQVPSADPNTLDDYEEGIWIPSVGGSATYGGTTAGKYTKIGNVVFVSCRLDITLIGTGSTTTIFGLPFAASALFSVPVGYWAGITTGYAYLTGVTTAGSTDLNFAGTTAAVTTANFAPAILGNGTTILCGGSYLT